MRWAELTTDQQRAIRGAVALLAGMVRPPDRGLPTIASPLPELDVSALDAERMNRTLLFDGGRGSGKTTAMVTLIHWLRRYSGRTRDSAQSFGDDAPLVDALDRALPPECSYVPLGVLDLEPLRPDRSLLLQVLSFFRRLVDQLDRRGRSEISRDDNPWTRREIPSLVRWRELERSVAQGWDSVLREIAAGLTPAEAYALLAESERAHAELQETFVEFVRALASDYAAALGEPGRRVLLVVAVDDADMNPERCLEILSLCHFLRSESVAFLLAGDSELFRRTLAITFAGRVHEPLRGLRGAETLVDSEFAQELATQALDKAIPPLHRQPIPRLSPNERQRRLAATSLGALLTDAPYLASALPDSLRGIDGLRGLLRRDDPSRAPWELELWQRSLDREMAASLRAVLRDAFMADRSGDGRALLRVGGGSLALYVGGDERRELGPFVLSPRPELRVAHTAGGDHAPTKLPEHVSAAGILCLVRASREDPRARAQVERHRLSPIEMLTVSDGGTVRAPLPAPSFGELADHLALLRAWSEAAGSRPLETPRDVLLAWLGAIAAVWSGLPPPLERELRGAVALLGNLRKQAPRTARTDSLARFWDELLPSYGLLPLGLSDEDVEVLRSHAGANLRRARETVAAYLGEAASSLLEPIAEDFPRAPRRRRASLGELWMELSRLRVHRSPSTGLPSDGTLADYLTARRFTAVEMSAVEAELQRALAALSAGQRDAAPALAAVWRALVPSDSSIDLVAGNIVVREPLLDGAATPREPRYVLPQPLGQARIYLCVGRLAGSLAEIIRELAADLQSDGDDVRELVSLEEGDRLHHSRGTALWFRGAQMVVTELGPDRAIPSLRWPAPHWPAPIDHEVLERAWNTLSEGAASEHPPPVDVLATGFLHAVLDTAQRRAVEPHVRNASLDAVRRAGFLVAERGRATGGARQQAIRAWAHAVLVMAAPESGLSHDWAGALLESVTSTLPEALTISAEVRAKRLAQAIQATTLRGMPVSEVASWIQRAVPDHPWYRYLRES